MTLIAVFSSEGCVGRCDSRCYLGTTPHCDCICGGMNHGVGLKKALDNTREHAEEMLEANCIDPAKFFEARIHPEVNQPSLPFPEEPAELQRGVS